ncbi:MAG: biotin--[acetyl-CoA-carboxylase] ligase [Alphaproteobacteria bacterium]|jgi:BirA family biotin operon repressor/biotin-[acetyl-CoA-carboxylase] ligase|nr:biotin--[acetyl-CoA-carboxylase] ligase [Alphaproteobacteria bacterium]
MIIEKSYLYEALTGNGNCYVVDQMESTMDPFKEMKLGDIELSEWDVIVARLQTKGKGRTGRKWLSEKDQTLCFSMALPTSYAALALKINIISGYAICDVIKEFVGDRAKVKWPNDVLVDKRKLSGILFHNNSGNLCMGIGVNINQTSFPEEIKDIATSLRIVTNKNHDPIEILDKILKSFIYKLKLLLSEELKIEEKYPEYSQYYNQKTKVHLKDGSSYKIIDKGIDEDGLLIAQKEDGTEEHLVSGIDVGINLYPKK